MRSTASRSTSDTYGIDPRQTAGPLALRVPSEFHAPARWAGLGKCRGFAPAARRTRFCFRTNGGVGATRPSDIGPSSCLRVDPLRGMVRPASCVRCPRPKLRTDGDADLLAGVHWNCATGNMSGTSLPAIVSGSDRRRSKSSSLNSSRYGKVLHRIAGTESQVPNRRYRIAGTETQGRKRGDLLGQEIAQESVALH